MQAPSTTAFGIQMQQPWAMTPTLPAPQSPQGPAPAGSAPLRALAPASSGYSARALPTPAPAPATTTSPRPTTPSAYTYAAPALAGLQAGQAGLGAYDTTTGVVSALGAAGAGAASGALSGAAIGAMGGPIGAGAGALIGGGVGLVTGALNAWMSVGAQNRARRERKRLLAEAKAEQARRDRIARADALDALAFERRELEEAKRLQEWQRNRALIAEAQAKKKARADEFIARGFVT